MMVEFNQIIDGKYIGYHEDLKKLPIQMGDNVIIKKGTRYHSMKDGKYHHAGKTHIVKVNHVLNGATWTQDNEEKIINPEVRWAGSGGYWHGVDINDIEKVIDKKL
jgi:hypothetical protein